MYKSVYLCEGVFNAITLSQIGESVLRVNLFHPTKKTNYQISSRRIILCLDGDAIEQAIQLALKLCYTNKSS